MALNLLSTVAESCIIGKYIFVYYELLYGGHSRSSASSSMASADRRQSSDATLVQAHHLFIRIIRASGLIQLCLEKHIDAEKREKDSASSSRDIN